MPNTFDFRYPCPNCGNMEGLTIEYYCHRTYYVQCGCGVQANPGYDEYDAVESWIAMMESARQIVEDSRWPTQLET